MHERSDATSKPNLSPQRNYIEAEPTFAGRGQFLTVLANEPEVLQVIAGWMIGSANNYSIWTVDVLDRSQEVIASELNRIFGKFGSSLRARTAMHENHLCIDVGIPLQSPRH